MKTIRALLLLTAAALLLTPAATFPAMAQTSEAVHNHGDDHNDEAKDTAHEDHDKHDDHEENAHDAHGHDDDHDESTTSITADAAARMGVAVEQAGPAAISHTVPLTGRIVLNQNTLAEVRARFSGIIRTVNVNLGATVVKGDVLAVVESNESLKTYNVTAPISGTVLTRNTNIGDVAGDDALFMLADLTNVWAKFHVFPRDADIVQTGQSVTVHTLEEDKSATGTIDMLFPTADELTQTLIAISELSNPEYKWKPGMTVEGDVVISSEEVAVTVKETALQKMEEQGDVVFVEDNGTFEARAVKTGRKGGGYVEITKGLATGESYAAQGSFIIKSDILKSTATHSH